MSRMLWISRQPFDPLSQRRIIGAGLVEVSSPLGGIILFQRGDKDGSFAHGDVSRSESCPAGVAPLAPPAALTLTLHAPLTRKSRQKKRRTAAGYEPLRASRNQARA
jgi:hypothetical protein